MHTQTLHYYPLDWISYQEQYSNVPITQCQPNVKVFKNKILQLTADPEIECLLLEGRGWGIGSVDAFRPKAHGFDSRSWRHVGTFLQVLHSQLPVALRRAIPTQHSCCVGTPRVAVDLKRRY